MTRVKTPLRASHLRDLLAEGPHQQQTVVRAVPPPQIQLPAANPPQLIGPENIRTESLSNNQMVNRTRYLWLPIASATVRSGTGTLAMRGTNTKYRAWNFRDAQTDEIECEFGLPSDVVYASPTAPISFRPFWTNLGAGAGSVVWRFTFNPSGGATTNQNSITDATSDLTDPAGTQDQLSFAPSASTVPAAAVTFSDSTTLLDQFINVRIMRLGNDPSDTLINDAGLLGVRVEYTADS